jgi:hypothetical protein
MLKLQEKTTPQSYDAVLDLFMYLLNRNDELIQALHTVHTALHVSITTHSTLKATIRAKIEQEV